MKKMKPGGYWGMGENEFMNTANPMSVMIFVNQLHKRKIEKMLQGTGLHRAQHRILMTLSRGEFDSQAELAAELEVSTATVAVSLKKLGRDGYIQKMAKEKDSRANFVCLTQKGRDVVEESKEAFSQIDAQAMRGFSEEELVTLRKYLKRVYENLTDLC